MSNQELVISDQTYMPAMSIPQAAARFNTLVEFVQTVMRPDVDYGVIPGTPKPTLLKPGAEKLTTLFGLTTRFVVVDKTEDWTGDQHGGELFFYYWYRCQLWRGDRLIAEADGSCNSRESKYRWREAKRVCPACNQATIIKGKAEYGGGWLCFKKQGGCGAKYSDGDQAIEGQPAGRIPNPDICDQVNTFQKMSQKRCLGGTTPILMLTSRGFTRTNIKTLYTIFENGNEDIYLPGVDGSWRHVEGMICDQNRIVYRIVLADGSSVRATPEHRFPTTKGLREVSSLCAGDVLLRSPSIGLHTEGNVPLDYAWVAGLFIAEGHYDNKSVKYTLNQDEEAFVEKIQAVAGTLGCTVNVFKGPGQRMDVQVHGPAFRGLIEQFVDGETSYRKHLSKAVWQQGAAFQQSLLDGYLAGDGSWREQEGRNPYWRIGFTGENYELAEDLRTLCAVLGHRISLKRSNARLKGVEFPTFVGFIKSNIKTYNQADLNEIVLIEQETKLGTVYDIQVDGDHLFCLANGIQTHNSMIAAVLIGVNASEFFTQDVEDIQMIGNGSSYIPPVQVVNASTGEIITTTVEDCEGERTLLKQLRDELKSIGGTPRPLTLKQVAAMSCEHLRAEIDTTGAALDERKRQKPAEPDTSEWDAIDAAGARRRGVVEESLPL